MRTTGDRSRSFRAGVGYYKMKKLLYLFGEPGTGKITVARILQERLGWRLFWLHDLDSVCAIVGRYPLPRLMDRISLAVLEELMDSGESVIYVRPSRDSETIIKVMELARTKGYAAFPVRLTATRPTLVGRVNTRERHPFRVSNVAELDCYLDARPSTSSQLEWVHTVDTEGRIPEQVADMVHNLLKPRN